MGPSLGAGGGRVVGGHPSKYCVTCGTRWLSPRARLLAACEWYGMVWCGVVLYGRSVSSGVVRYLLCLVLIFCEHRFFKNKRMYSVGWCQGCGWTSTQTRVACDTPLVLVAHPSCESFVRNMVQRCSVFAPSLLHRPHAIPY